MKKKRCPFRMTGAAILQSADRGDVTDADCEGNRCALWVKRYAGGEVMADGCAFAMAADNLSDISFNTL